MKHLKYLILTTVMGAPLLAAQTDALVGRWKSTTSKDTFEFTADGRVVAISQAIGAAGRYETREGRTLDLKFEGDGAPPKIEFSYKVEGEFLKLTDATGKMKRFKRAADNAAAKP